MKKQILIALIVTSAALCFARQINNFSVIETKTGLEISEAGKKVCAYRKIPDSKKFSRSHYFHPVYDLSENVMTEDFPPDHLHHHGIWWAWHQIRQNGKQISNGWQNDNIHWDVKKLAHKLLPSGKLLLTMNVDWLTNDQKLLIKEKSTALFHPSEKHYRVIDFDITLSSDGTIEIGGADNAKGYSGFSLRLKEMENLQFSDRNGKIKPETNAVNAGSWMNFTRPPDGKSGVVIMCHDTKPDKTAPWILRSSKSMQNPVFPGRECVPVPKDGLNLKYRIVIHDTTLDKNQIQSIYDSYKPTSGLHAEQISGELKKWHKITLTFDGPQTGENATPNPFLFYRLNVTFTHEKSGTTYIVPGYFAADGNAADTSAEVGNKWRLHFAPDKIGRWNYKVSFRKGDYLSISTDPLAGKSAGYMDGLENSFDIAASDKQPPDLRAKGRLDYVGGHYLQFAETKEYFLKEGTDAPENLLAYADFDGNFKNDGHKDNLIKTWDAHIKDWRNGDPSWQIDKGKGLIGAINYLASEGLNAFSFLTFNIAGDDRNVFPYTDYNEKFRFDVSRLDQWEIVFAHGDRLGMFLHFKTQETENETWHDNGNVGPERMLYYRQLIARFSHHLAMNWNLGEENGFWKSKKEHYQNSQQRRAMAQYFWDNDPYRHHIVIHNGQWFDDLAGDRSKLTGISLQTNKTDFSKVHDTTLRVIRESVKAGKPWAVACDEPGDASHSLVPDKDDPTHNDARINALWGNLLAGGWGCEYYFGYKHDHSDLTCQDFRSRDDFWDQCRIALSFFKDQNIPFWTMRCDDSLTDRQDDFCFFKEDSIYLIYQKKGGEVNFNLPPGKYESGWFNPRTGAGSKKLLNKKLLAGPAKINLTAPDNKDWLLLIRRR